MATKDAMEVGADFVGFTSTNGVALCASGLEERGALRNVTCDELITASASCPLLLALACLATGRKTVLVRPVKKGTRKFRPRALADEEATYRVRKALVLSI
jgi:hypothetical protein